MLNKQELSNSIKEGLIQSMQEPQTQVIEAMKSRLSNGGPNSIKAAIGNTSVRIQNYIEENPGVTDLAAVGQLIFAEELSNAISTNVWISIMDEWTPLMAEVASQAISDSIDSYIREMEIIVPKGQEVENGPRAGFSQMDFGKTTTDSDPAIIS